jgi:hypothetical protein
MLRYALRFHKENSKKKSQKIFQKKVLNPPPPPPPPPRRLRKFRGSRPAGSGGYRECTNSTKRLRQIIINIKFLFAEKRERATICTKSLVFKIPKSLVMLMKELISQVSLAAKHTLKLIGFFFVHS